VRVSTAKQVRVTRRVVIDRGWRYFLT
jgi:hypothetical protein